MAAARLEDVSLSTRIHTTRYDTQACRTDKRERNVSTSWWQQMVAGFTVLSSVMRCQRIQRTHVRSMYALRIDHGAWLTADARTCNRGARSHEAAGA